MSENNKFFWALLIVTVLSGIVFFANVGDWWNSFSNWVEENIEEIDSESQTNDGQGFNEDYEPFDPDEFTVPDKLEVIDLNVADQDLKVEVADTVGTRFVGLSNRDSLGENDGMLFVFDQPGDLTFWMKDMKFDLDMIWLNADKEIVHIERNVSPDTYPKTFSSEQPAQYVLEVNAGFSDQYELKVGDPVVFAYRVGVQQL